jgi:protein gp37
MTRPEYWKKPLRWNKEAEQAGVRTKVFCSSLSDVFEDWRGEILSSKGLPMWRCCCGHWFDAELQVVPCPKCGDVRASMVTMNHVRQRLFQLIDQTPHLDWLLLTKRPENILEMWPDRSFHCDKSLQEIRMPISGYPGYEVSNLGVVYTLRGAELCCMCGGDVAGNKQKRYCSQQCRQKSHYRRTVKNEPDPYDPTAKPLDGEVGEDGHTRVTLYRNGQSERMLVHRIVLATFDRPAIESEQARHLDGNPRNNRIDNLCWGTQSRNWDDSKEHRTHRRYHKLSPDQVDEIRDRRRGGETLKSIADEYGVSDTQIRNIVSGRQWKDYQPRRENCWIGTSVENQECADKRIPELLKCRHLSPVLFLSCEPLLGEVDLCYPPSLYPNGPQNCCSGFECGCRGLPIDPPEYLWSPDGDTIDWVIIGGESGPLARPMNPHHARLLINQCKTFGVPVFVKQVGEWASFATDYSGLHIVAHPEDGSDVLIGADVDGKRYGRDHVYLNDLDEIAYVKVGRKAAGHLFEGVEYSQFPKVGE